MRQSLIIKILNERRQINMRRTGKFIGMFVVTLILILAFGIPAFAGWFDNSAKVVTGTTTLEEMTFT